VVKKDATDGERLCTFIKKNLIDDDLWPEFSSALIATGRDKEWRLFVEEVISTQLTGRLVSSGKSIAEDLGGKKFILTLQFEQRMKSLIDETTRGGLGNRDVKARLTDLTTNAVLATYETLKAADDKLIRTEAGRVPQCFLCNRRLVMVKGAAVRELSEDERQLAVEVEHVWPRSYGGNTIAENLAFACHGCNQRKENYANWAMVDSQSFILGWNPDTDDLQEVPGWRRFALTSWRAHQIAENGSLTLKQAFFRLTSVVLDRPRVMRLADAADFFNITNHTEID
jgi:5-methylcytosine-specific restriction endonuclease McrA